MASPRWNNRFHLQSSSFSLSLPLFPFFPNQILVPDRVCLHAVANRATWQRVHLGHRAKEATSEAMHGAGRGTVNWIWRWPRPRSEPDWLARPRRLHRASATWKLARRLTRCEPRLPGYSSTRSPADTLPCVDRSATRTYTRFNWKCDGYSTVWIASGDHEKGSANRLMKIRRTSRPDWLLITSLSLERASTNKPMLATLYVSDITVLRNKIRVILLTLFFEKY